MHKTLLRGKAGWEPGSALRVALAAGLALCASGAAMGRQPEQPAPIAQSAPEALQSDGARHRVSQFVIRYAQENPDHPSEAAVLAGTITLGVTAEGFVAPRQGLATETFRLADLVDSKTPGFLFDSALPLVAPAVVRRLQELGLIGVYVEPDPEEFRVEDGRIVDRRPARQRHMTLVVTTGVVTQIRSSALGERFAESESVDNPAHAQIREHSPVRAREAPDEPAPEPKPETAKETKEKDTRPDLVRRDLIDAYVHRLNRHPGRRVDVALAPSGQEIGGVTLDYLVTENRPWLFFFQLSNTGTESTNDLRERFGFIHNQLTNNDDIFSIDYLTGDFEDVNAVTASYDRPLGDFDSRLRFKAYGSYYTYTASDVGLPGADFDGDGWTAGAEVRWNFFQEEDLFVDLVGGARFERVRVDNKLADQEGDEPFLLPYIGVQLQRVRESEQTYAGVLLEFNAPDLAGTDPDEIDLLGRLDVDDSWATLQWHASHSFYLDRLFAKDKNAPTSLAHEIALSANGQFAFDSRLAPNFEQTVGGLYSVRGYPESIVAGDTAYVASVEYRFHLPQGLTPSVRPGEAFGTPFRYAPQYVSGPTDWDLIFKGFVDIGRVENSHRQSYELDQTLVGAGVGVELSFTRRLNVRVDWGFALEGLDDPDGGNLVDSGNQEVRFVLTLIF
jgi:hemolysin activation/secretion protein